MDGKSTNPYEPSSVVEISRSTFTLINIIDMFFCIYGGFHFTGDVFNSEWFKNWARIIRDLF